VVKPLFVYGTLRDAAWRRAILGAEYPAAPATLTGWRRIATSPGYLTIRRTLPRLDVAPIEGGLVVLDAVGWEIADAWEEARYERVDVRVNTMDGARDAIVYVCPEDDDATPVDDGRLSLLSRAHVDAAIASFEATMRAIRERERPA
jgi:gamma-glutamylcyclotransferase (GGCT)/AIG2-like uncharacterized protein YtfP